MFTKMKNIDTAFRQVRTLTIVIVSFCFLLSTYAVYKGFASVETSNDKIYLLANGQAIKANLSSRSENLAVEVRDHVKNFHRLFFTLDPDDKVIKENITQALYLADGSAKQAYDDLQEKGFYNGIISGNISQRINIDSVQVDVNTMPYKFNCFATQEIIRSTNTLKRKLLTSGTIREVSRSDNNPHGFLIQQWKILVNQDINPLNYK
jgi:conjugative transposon TraK protein